jgi:hypothetical protein
MKKAAPDEPPEGTSGFKATNTGGFIPSPRTIFRAPGQLNSKMLKVFIRRLNEEGCAC